MCTELEQTRAGVNEQDWNKETSVDCGRLDTEAIRLPVYGIVTASKGCKWGDRAATQGAWVPGFSHPHLCKEEDWCGRSSPHVFASHGNPVALANAGIPWSLDESTDCLLSFGTALRGERETS
jgi:hypothetical protein